MNVPIITRSRAVERVVRGVPVSDGAGVRIFRLLARELQHRLDPFLMLDVFRSDNPDDYLAGFPDHPHRGFEAITYLIAGRMRHRDSAGHEGLLRAGDVQWMSAGRGIVHSEMPEQERGAMEGFQLWLNLPAAKKMSAPWYRDIPQKEIPEFVTETGVTVRVIAGHCQGMLGAVTRPQTAPVYLDLHFPTDTVFSEILPPTMNAFVVVYRGEAAINGTPINEREMAVLANTGDGVAMYAQRPARALLIAGKPLGEPIAQHGPFVMNTEEQLRTAVRDFQEGQFVLAEPVSRTKRATNGVGPPGPAGQ